MNILLYSKENDFSLKLSNFLDDSGYTFFICSTEKESIELIANNNVELVIINKNRSKFSGELRDRFFGKIMQIIYCAEADEDIGELLNFGYDDFIRKPFEKLEYKARIRASVIRLNQQKQLLEERNYFENAAKREEELSSKVLDEQIHLRRAFRDIEEINTELTISNEKLERMAKFDLLSGLYNRLNLFNYIDIEIERALRTESELSGIMMDIDHFKTINDNFGHLLGDEVIRAFGQQLDGTLRKYDIAGRYGGEEFFVILPNTNINAAQIIAERFRKKIMKHEFTSEDGSFYITVSIGIAGYKNYESRESWIARADGAMYKAKQNGRNRTVIDPMQEYF